MILSKEIRCSFFFFLVGCCGGVLFSWVWLVFLGLWGGVFRWWGCSGVLVSGPGFFLVVFPFWCWLCSGFLGGGGGGGLVPPGCVGGGWVGLLWGFFFVVGVFSGITYSDPLIKC